MSAFDEEVSRIDTEIAFLMARRQVFVDAMAPVSRAESSGNAGGAANKARRRRIVCDKPRFDRLAYQREYMRKRRAKQKERDVTEAGT